MRLSPDELVYWRYGFFVINSTIVTTWALMLVMSVGAMLITRRLVLEGQISRWQGILEIVVTTIQKQIKEVGLHYPEKYLGFIGTLFSVHRGVESLHDSSRVRTTDRLALDNDDGGWQRRGVCRRAALRHRGAGIGPLPQDLLDAHVPHAAVQHHQRGLSHRFTLSIPPVRQHHEWNNDRRDFADDHAPRLPDFHGPARAFDRYGPGLHFQRPCHRLYRSRHSFPFEG